MRLNGRKSTSARRTYSLTINKLCNSQRAHSLTKPCSGRRDQRTTDQTTRWLGNPHNTQCGRARRHKEAHCKRFRITLDQDTTISSNSRFQSSSWRISLRVRRSDSLMRLKTYSRSWKMCIKKSTRLSWSFTSGQSRKIRPGSAQVHTTLLIIT